MFQSFWGTLLVDDASNVNLGRSMQGFLNFICSLENDWTKNKYPGRIIFRVKRTEILKLFGKVLEVRPWLI